MVIKRAVVLLVHQLQHVIHPLYQYINLLQIIMTKTIKIVLILVGFIVLCGIKLALEANNLGGGVLFPILAMAYLAFAGAIWKYNKQ